MRPASLSSLPRPLQLPHTQITCFQNGEFIYSLCVLLQPVLMKGTLRTCTSTKKSFPQEESNCQLMATSFSFPPHFLSISGPPVQIAKRQESVKLKGTNTSTGGEVWGPRDKIQ
jgi:hypothetical protein